MSKPYKSIGQLKPPKDSGGGGIYVKKVELMDEKTDKIEILHRRQTDPAL